MPGIIARPVVSGLSRPVFATAPPADQRRLFILEQHTGKILIFRFSTNTLAPQPFLKVGPLSQGNEQGLLGLAFAPDFNTSGLFYVNFHRCQRDDQYSTLQSVSSQSRPG